MVAIWQEHLNLKKFGDSLLTRANKLSKLIGDIEKGIDNIENKDTSCQAKRAQKPEPWEIKPCFNLTSFAQLCSCFEPASKVHRRTGGMHTYLERTVRQGSGYDADHARAEGCQRPRCHN